MAAVTSASPARGTANAVRASAGGGRIVRPAGRTTRGPVPSARKLYQQQCCALWWWLLLLLSHHGERTLARRAWGLYNLLQGRPVRNRAWVRWVGPRRHDPRQLRAAAWRAPHGLSAPLPLSVIGKFRSVRKWRLRHSTRWPLATRQRPPGMVSGAVGGMRRQDAAYRGRVRRHDRTRYRLSFAISSARRAA